MPCHLLIGYTHFPPVVPIFFVGIALSLVPAALWAAIPMMVPESRLGTAFGVVGYVQNIGLLALPAPRGEDRGRPHHPGQRPARHRLHVDDADVRVARLVGFVFSLLLKAADARRKTGISIEEVLTK